MDSDRPDRPPVPPAYTEFVGEQLLSHLRGVGVSAPGTTSGQRELEIENRLLRRQLLAARVENQRLTGLLTGVLNVHIPEPEQAADDAAALVDAVCPPTRRRRNGEP